jgi:SAM-dependent MidA family methyltransferase
VTVAAFMDRALYHPELGYYARAACRSGRAGDFFTSVDVGPLFGELLAVQIREMAGLLASNGPVESLDLVEAGAGSGRLAADVVRALRASDPRLYAGLALHLVEASARARDAQRDTLGDTAGRLRSSSAALPESFEGVLIANELLDALPVHQVVMREEGLKEVYVGSSLSEGPPSTPRLAEYLDAAGARLEPGWRAEVNLNAVDWVRDAARRLRRGFMILIDYGHEARELYSVTHASGTLTSFSRHQSAGPERASPVWLERPGEQDITSHVDFTSVRSAAEAEGMVTLGLLDQTYFLMALSSDWTPDRLAARASALKTLIMPGGLGSTQKVLLLGKNVGSPGLRGCSFRVRIT